MKLELCCVLNICVKCDNIVKPLGNDQIIRAESEWVNFMNLWKRNFGKDGEHFWKPIHYCREYKFVRFSSVQSLSSVQLFVIPRAAARQAPLSNTNSWSLPKLMSIESVMPPNHLILYCPLLFLPSIFPSIRVLSKWVSSSHQVPKYWNFSFNISPTNENPGLISFRMDWLDFLTVQGTLKVLLQHRSSKASILWCSVFFIVQLYFSQACQRTLEFYTF